MYNILNNRSNIVMPQYQNGNSLELEDFYFNNTYPNDQIKSGNMRSNVRKDLEPFTAFINSSIDRIGQCTSEGAVVKEIKLTEKYQTKYLSPKFSLIRLKNINKGLFIVSKPNNFFVLHLDYNECDDFDFGSFEICRRRDLICSYKNKIDCYNGTVFVKLSDDIIKKLDDGTYELYDDKNHKSTSIKCKISKIDYNDFSSYRIDGLKVKSVEEKESELIFRTESDISYINKIKLCGQTICITNKKNVAISEISGENFDVKKIDTSLYFVCPEIPSKKFPKLFTNENPLEYEKIDLSDLGEKELCSMLKTKDISIRDGRIIYTGDQDEEVSFGDYIFKVKSEKIKFKKLFYDEKKNYFGTVIEVITDSKSIKDLESNTDIFFKETTERLTDKLPFRKGENRSFKIGRREEDLNLLEIVEEKDGKLERVKNLPSRLYAVPNDWQLKKQKDAIEKLSKMPCREIKGLLELFERKSDDSSFGARWETFSPIEVTEWYILTDESYDGCNEQREFVRKALATPDFCFLEGPPGTGKTTCLLELIAQLVVRGKRILLTASTNAAVDNILERIKKLPEKIQNLIFAVRIGNEGVFSDTVSNYALSDIPEEYSNEILRCANIVCGTIFGILKHPEFRLNDRNQPVRPLFDYLIIDESSKTTFQDFLIPALYSRHWILSGDLMQLTPYVEQETIQASLEEIPEFNKNMQFIQTVIGLVKDNRIVDMNIRLALD